MSVLAKLNLKNVNRSVEKDPVIARRDKLLRAIEEQVKVLTAALAGEEYTVAVKRWGKNEAGERVRVEGSKLVRAWFFEQDGGWFVQCKYGARPLRLGEKGNAVFVKELKDVTAVLEAFYAACAAGEFDKAVSEIAVRKKD